MRIAVVGGGIAGLAAAHDLAGAADVTVFEASPTLGGKLQTATFAGVPVELGPDLFLARVPWATELCRAVGLGDDLVPPSTSRAFVWTRGALRPLPEGLLLGVPTDLVAVARSGILSPLGLARAALDAVLPRTRLGDDPSVGFAVERRFGREVTERLVNPLVGGINAGQVHQLSLDAVPQLAEVLRRHRSLLVRGLRSAPSPAAGGPVFLTVAGGLGRLVDALAGRVGEVRTSTRVEEVRAEAGGVVVRVDGDDERFDGAVLALPAFAAADVVAAHAPALAHELAAIPYASVSVLLAAFDRTDVAHPLDGSGFVVPAIDGRLLTAATFTSTKWAAMLGDAAAGTAIFRLSAGRYGDDRAMHLGEGELTERLLADLDEAVGLSGPPTATRLVRWARAFPQQVPGHRARLAEVARLAAHELPGVQLAGAAFGGVGIPACVRSGRDAAATLRGRLGA